MTGNQLLARFGLDSSAAPSDPDENRRKALQRLAATYGIDLSSADAPDQLREVGRKLQSPDEGILTRLSNAVFNDPIREGTGAVDEEKLGFGEKWPGRLADYAASAASQVNERFISPAFESLGELASGPERGTVAAPQIAMLATRLGGKNVWRALGYPDEVARKRAGLPDAESQAPARAEFALMTAGAVPMEVGGQTLLGTLRGHPLEGFLTGARRAAEGTGAGVLGMVDPELGREAAEAAALGSADPYVNDALLFKQFGQSQGSKWAEGLGLDEKTGQAFDTIASILGPVAIHGAVEGARARSLRTASEKANLARLRGDWRPGETKASIKPRDVARDEALAAAREELRQRLSRPETGGYGDVAHDIYMKRVAETEAALGEGESAYRQAASRLEPKVERRVQEFLLPVDFPSTLEPGAWDAVARGTQSGPTAWRMTGIGEQLRPSADMARMEIAHQQLLRRMTADQPKAETPRPRPLSRAGKLLDVEKQRAALAAALEQNPEIAPMDVSRPREGPSPKILAPDPFKMEKLPSQMSALELARKGLLPDPTKSGFQSLGSLGAMKFDPTAAQMRAELLRRGAKGISDAVKMLEDAGIEDPHGVASWAWTHGLAPQAQAAAAGIVAGKPQLSEPAQKLVAAVREAKEIPQEQVLTEFRAKQAAKMRAVTAGGEEGYYQKRAAMAGEAPKAAFEGIRSKLETSEINDLMTEIENHPSLRGDQFAIANAQGALIKMLGPKEAGFGQVPQPAELAKLERIFGTEFAEAAMKLRPERMGYLGDVLGFLKSSASGGDLSAMLRQGAIVTAAHPVKAVPVTIKMLQSAIPSYGEAVFRAVQRDIETRPKAPLYREAALHFIEPDLISLDAAMRDEAFMAGRRLERLPGLAGATFRGLAKLRRPAERAYVTYINKFRADLFDSFHDQLLRDGTATPENVKALGTAINNMTGRGTLGGLEKAGGALSQALFSPRLIAARVQTINPVYWYKMPKAIKWMILKDHAAFLGVGLSALALAKAAGAEVQTDPRSSDFGKAKFGRIRIGAFGGFEQYFAFLARFMSATNGMKAGTTVTARGAERPISRLDLTGRFIMSKIAPGPGLVRDLLAGQGMFGQSLEAEKMVGDLFVPLFVRDAYEALSDSPDAVGAGATLAALLGAGVNTYGENVAPELMVKTPAENFIDNAMAEKSGKRERTETEREATARRHALESAIRNKQPDAARQLNEALDTGAITPEQAESLMKAAKMDPWDTRFKRLSLPEAEKAYQLARPAEKARWKPFLEERRMAARATTLDAYKRLAKNDHVGPGLNQSQEQELVALRRRLGEMRRQRIAADKARRMAEARFDEAAAP